MTSLKRPRCEEDDDALLCFVQSKRAHEAREGAPPAKKKRAPPRHRGAANPPMAIYDAADLMQYANTPVAVAALERDYVSTQDMRVLEEKVVDELRGEIIPQSPSSVTLMLSGVRLHPDYYSAAKWGSADGVPTLRLLAAHAVAAPSAPFPVVKSGLNGRPLVKFGDSVSALIQPPRGDGIARIQVLSSTTATDYLSIACYLDRSQRACPSEAPAPAQHDGATKVRHKRVFAAPKAVAAAAAAAASGAPEHAGAGLAIAEIHEVMHVGANLRRDVNKQACAARAMAGGEYAVDSVGARSCDPLSLSRAGMKIKIYHTGSVAVYCTRRADGILEIARVIDRLME